MSSVLVEETIILVKSPSTGKPHNYNNQDKGVG